MAQHLIHATKGHGTENDFLLVLRTGVNDPDLSAAQIAALCDRTAGAGADGLIQIKSINNRWFMDYRNSDGSLAEMCGNGIRVMARYLAAKDLEKSSHYEIDTRDGAKLITMLDDGHISVAMGQVTIDPATPEISYGDRSWIGMKVLVGNPHAIAFVDSLDIFPEELEAPSVIPEAFFPEGANVEFVELVSQRHVKIRVFERGAGETRSCGTGVCAVAAATAYRAGTQGASEWNVSVPGGELTVLLDDRGFATLIGPAVLVSELEIDLNKVAK